MLGVAFYWILNMSLMADIAGIVVLLLRRSGAMPARVSVLLWLAPFLRMSVPIWMNSSASILSLLKKISGNSAVFQYRPFPELDLSLANGIKGASSYAPFSYRNDLLERVIGASAAVWVVAAAILLVFTALAYFFSLREVRSAEHVGDNVYRSRKVSCAAVYGIIRPKIVLPAASFAEHPRGEDHVLLHERMHIRRLDNLWRLLALSIACVHWFNPLAWVFLKKLFCDIELACDECVMLELGEGARKEYARTLLSQSESRRTFGAAFGGSQLGLRIKRILSYRKVTGASLFASLLFVAFMVFALLANPKA